MMIQIKRGKLSDHELIYLHDSLQDANISCCKTHMEMIDGQGVCPCKAHRICKALASSISFIEKQLPEIYSPTE